MEKKIDICIYIGNWEREIAKGNSVGRGPGIYGSGNQSTRACLFASKREIEGTRKKIERVDELVHYEICGLTAGLI